MTEQEMRDEIERLQPLSNIGELVLKLPTIAIKYSPADKVPFDGATLTCYPTGKWYLKGDGGKVKIGPCISAIEALTQAFGDKSNG